MSNEIWYRGHRIVQERESAWHDAETKIWYAGSDLSEMGAHLQRVPVIHTVRSGEGIAQAIEKINFRGQIHGDEGPQGHQLIMDVKTDDLLCRLRTDEHGHMSGTVRGHGDHPWDMPAEMESLADAMDLFLAYRSIREFYNANHPRQYSRLFYTAWILNGRTPGVP